MIQDIAPHVYHNEYREQSPVAGDTVLFYNGAQVLCRLEDGRIRYPLFQVAGEAGGPYRYLFTIDERKYFLGLGQGPEGYGLATLQQLRESRDPMERFAGVTGSQLAQWYRDSSFCGRCGTPTEPDHKERMMRCPKCGATIYPRISPAVIVGVTDGDKLLLTKYSDRPVRGYGLIAGFNEIGETIEETVHREVREEVGLRVKNLRFYKSQPWSFSGCLLMGFFCDLDGEEKITLQEDELAEGTWFSREDLHHVNENVSLTNEMICLFQEGKEPR